jgi:hypothetical protein
MAFLVKSLNTTALSKVSVISPLPLQSSDQGQRLELENGWEFLVDPSARLAR